MRFLKKILIEDFGLKLASLIIAVFFFVAVHDEKETEDFIRVGVQLENHPANLTITNTVVESVNLAVKGTRAQIEKLKDSPPKPYQVNLEGVSPGRALFRIFPFDFKLPEGVQITRINPQLITIEVETLVSKRLPVEPNIVGTLENGFEIVETRITPDQVILKGPKSALDVLGKVKTTAIPLDGARKSFSGAYELDFSRLGNVSADEENNLISIEVQIQEKTISSVLSDVPVQIDGASNELAARLIVEPKTVSMVIKGMAGLINDLSESGPKVMVRFKPNTAVGVKAIKAKVEVEPIEGLEVLNITPKRVSVKVKG